MNGYLAGLVGFICALLIFSLGCFAGWRAKSLLDKKAQLPSLKFPSLDEMSPEEREETLKERRSLKETQKAWENLMTYSSDIAYGLNGGDAR